MTTQTLRCKPLNRCTVADIIPMDGRLREDAIDYLAGNGYDVSFCGPKSCGLDHLLRLCAEVDSSGGGYGDLAGILTIQSGGFAGHFATPATIERLKAEVVASLERAQLRVRSGDLRALSPRDEQQVADELRRNPHRHHEILDSYAARLTGSLGPHPVLAA